MTNRTNVEIENSPGRATTFTLNIISRLEWTL